MFDGPTQPNVGDGAEAGKPRRRRRTREDVELRIHEAARQLFADRGYALTTTKDIARIADVSETLLFRYYGDKVGLFGEVITQPFQLLMNDFVSRHPDPTDDGDRGSDLHRFTRQVYTLFETNEGLFRALLAGPGQSEALPPLVGLGPFFAQSVDQVSRRYAAAGQEPPFDLAVGVRLGFGMIAASVLLRDSLFFQSNSSAETITATLDHFIFEMLAGPPSC